VKSVPFIDSVFLQPVSARTHSHHYQWALEQFRNYCGLIKDGEVWFSLQENHEEAYRFPDFLQRGTRWEK
jgi:hypothetical protein